MIIVMAVFLNVMGWLFLVTAILALKKRDSAYLDASIHNAITCFCASGICFALAHITELIVKLGASQ